jgi:hypothetical protein
VRAKIFCTKAQPSREAASLTPSSAFFVASVGTLMAVIAVDYNIMNAMSTPLSDISHMLRRNGFEEYHIYSLVLTW